jgi:hypothetical protein
MESTDSNMCSINISINPEANTIFWGLSINTMYDILD